MMEGWSVVVSMTPPSIGNRFDLALSLRVTDGLHGMHLGGSDK